MSSLSSPGWFRHQNTYRFLAVGYSGRYEPVTFSAEVEVSKARHVLTHAATLATVNGYQK